MSSSSASSRYRKEQGDIGEDIASKWLESKGWKILERNFRIHGGEVDIIARDGVFLSFVEVKHWKANLLEDLGHVLGRLKKSRMHKAARVWLEANTGILWPESVIRFDLVTVVMESREVALYAGALDF